jgi:site-specific recombinase XerD
VPEAVRLALTALRKEQAADRLKLGLYYQTKHDLVFRDNAGRPMSRQRLNLAFKDVLEAARHVNSNVTRAVYRHQISDTVTRAPAALDQALGGS